MAYWILDKITGEPKVMGAMKTVAFHTGINYRLLVKVFSIKEEKEYQDRYWRIAKVEYETASNYKKLNRVNELILNELL